MKNVKDLVYDSVYNKVTLSTRIEYAHDGILWKVHHGVFEAPSSIVGENVTLKTKQQIIDNRT